MLGARSPIRYQITIARLPLARDVGEFQFADTRINEKLVHKLATGNFLAHQRNVALCWLGAPARARRTWRLRAKVVLIGAPEQLQAIEAGAAFRALAERHGAAEITTIRRQHEAWQRDATRELATGRTEAALERYAATGMVRAVDTREGARAGLVAIWGRRGGSGRSRAK